MHQCSFTFATLASFAVQDFLPVGIETAGIENAGGIESAFEIALYGHQRGRQWLEYADRLVAAAKQCRMAAAEFCGVAHGASGVITHCASLP